MIQSTLLFIVGSSLWSLLLSLAWGQLTPVIAVSGIGVGLVLSIYFYEKESWSQKLFTSLIFVLCSFQFLYLFFEKNLTDAGFYTLNPNNLGDLPFHINMIKAFARGLHFWPENPIFIGEVLKYPFGMNLFNAQFEILGLPLQTHLVLSGLVCLALSILALNRWMGPWGVAAFFFSGSSFEWKNLFLSVFVTQRGALLAIPAASYLLSEITTAKSLSFKKKIALGMIWGGLAFFHLHSFFIVSIFVGLTLFSQKKAPKFLLGVTAAISLPLILVALAPSAAWVNPIRISWGWMLADNENIFIFLLKNFGSWIALIPFLAWFSFKKKDQVFLVFSGFAVTALFFNLMLAPWAWDQIKILMWCYLFLNVLAYQVFIRKFTLRIQLLIAVIIFSPGLVQVVRSLPAFSKDQAVLLFNRSELDALTPAMKEIDPNDRVYIEPRYDHPIFYFGQSVVMGYPGHIWSHGYSPALLEDKIKAVVAGHDIMRFQELGAKFILRDGARTLVKVPSLPIE